MGSKPARTSLHGIIIISIIKRGDEVKVLINRGIIIKSGILTNLKLTKHKLTMCIPDLAYGNEDRSNRKEQSKPSRI